jgi:hypothetical protein
VTTPNPSSKDAAPSKEARRLAAVLLDVLAGSRSPAQAAESLGLSLPRYYQLEARGLQGMLAACEPRPRGRQPGTGVEAESLRKENAALRRDLLRQQSLVRLTQRTLGVSPPVPRKDARRKRKPVVRAMRRAAAMREEAGAACAGASGTE